MNERDLSRTERRREFIRAGARYMALGAVAVLATVLARRHALAPVSPECVQDGLCGGCPAFAGCGLPPARSARQAGIRG